MQPDRPQVRIGSFGGCSSSKSSTQRSPASPKHESVRPVDPKKHMSKAARCIVVQEPCRNWNCCNVRLPSALSGLVLDGAAPHAAVGCMLRIVPRPMRIIYCAAKWWLRAQNRSVGACRVESGCNRNPRECRKTPVQCWRIDYTLYLASLLARAVRTPNQIWRVLRFTQSPRYAGPATEGGCLIFREGESGGCGRTFLAAAPKCHARTPKDV